MSISDKYCRETLNASGGLEKIEINCPDNFNFGYDVVDAIETKLRIKPLLYGAMSKMKNISSAFRM